MTSPMILDSHLRTCVIDGITDGRGAHVVEELLELYTQANG